MRVETAAQSERAAIQAANAKIQIADCMRIAEKSSLDMLEKLYKVIFTFCVFPCFRVFKYKIMLWCIISQYEIRGVPEMVFHNMSEVSKKNWQSILWSHTRFLNCILNATTLKDAKLKRPQQILKVS